MVGETTFERYAKHIAVAVVVLLILLPVYWMVNMSLKDRAEFAARPPTLIVERPTTANYYDLLVTQRFYLKGRNSLIVAIIAATLAVTVGTLAAYALSRFRLPKNFNYHLLFTILTIRMFPPIVTVIPLFAFYNREFFGFKLYDTQIGLGLIHGFMELPLVLWMMIGFFRDIPRDMEEAALVDGDSRFAVLRKIALPLVAPGLAATFILVFISSWNEFLVALILTGSRAQTLPIAVAGQIGQYDVQWGNMMAAGVITTIPVLILALLTQRYLTRGLAVGGVTG
ncbi:MAG: carbohydrate transporter permease [Thermomicrobiales bacterium]|jgi:multiple sugar transport system permease protein|nr:carbohydrate transporter permease [Thermomicrobiales bacterium]